MHRSFNQSINVSTVDQYRKSSIAQSMVKSSIIDD